MRKCVYTQPETRHHFPFFIVESEIHSFTKFYYETTRRQVILCTRIRETFHSEHIGCCCRVKKKFFGDRMSQMNERISYRDGAAISNPGLGTFPLIKKYHQIFIPRKLTFFHTIDGKSDSGACLTCDWHEMNFNVQLSILNFLSLTLSLFLVVASLYLLTFVHILQSLLE
jgi:hypothetical protein